MVWYCAGGVFGGVVAHLRVVLGVLLLEVLGGVVLLALVLRVAYALEGVLGCGAGGLLDVQVAEVEFGLGVVGLGWGLEVVGGLGLVLLFVGGVRMLRLGVK